MDAAKLHAEDPRLGDVITALIDNGLQRDAHLETLELLLMAMLFGQCDKRAVFERFDQMVGIAENATMCDSDATTKKFRELIRAHRERIMTLAQDAPTSAVQ